MKSTCKSCDKNFNVLTKEELCAFCFQKEKGFWSSEFSNYSKDKKGNLISKEGSMKFKKTKHRNKKSKKKKRK